MKFIKSKVHKVHKAGARLRDAVGQAKRKASVDGLADQKSITRHCESVERRVKQSGCRMCNQSTGNVIDIVYFSRI